jgi:hypothetical protein
MNDDVNTPSESQEVEATTDIVEETVEETPVTIQEPGSKTDSSLLLKSLQEEREKRRILEEELDILRSSSTEGYTEDDVAKQVAVLESRIKTFEEKEVIGELKTKFPALKDKMEEFNEFRKDYPKDRLEAVAKVFLAENNLLGTPEPRKGLEKTSGGGRVIPQAGPTQEEIKTIRETNSRLYAKMVREGKI